MASQNTFSAISQISRDMTNRSSKTIETVSTLKELTGADCLEPTIAAGATNVAISLASAPTVNGIVIVTSKPIGVRINGADPLKCGQIFLLVDTSITSLAIDNDLQTLPSDVQIEIWIVSTA